MSTPQQRTVDQLLSTGFKIIRDQGDMVLMSSGADHRLVRTDGSQRHGNHIERGVGR